MKRIIALLMALLMVSCLAGMAAADGEPAGDGVQYRLIEEDPALLDIEADAVPLAAAPEQMCCAMHFVLMLGALAAAVYYAHDRKAGQARMYELRRADIG